MNNCLRQGSHLASCLSGDAHILSVRRNNIPVMNITLQKGLGASKSEKRRWSIAEYQGRDHMEPTPELLHHLQTFRQMLATGRIAIILNQSGRKTYDSTNVSVEVRQFLEKGVQVKPDIPSNNEEKIPLLPRLSLDDYADTWSRIRSSILQNKGGIEPGDRAEG